MANAQRLARITPNSLGEQLAADFMSISLAAESIEDCRIQILKKIKQVAKADQVQIIRGTKGQWRTVSQSDEHDGSPPVDLLAEVLDQEKTLGQDQNVASLLDPQRLAGQVLVISGGDSDEPQRWDSVAACAAESILLTVRRLAQAKRADRLRRMLDITQSWNQSRETDKLLYDMAEAATQLLDAERATIFLWDKTNHQLVGRPALGVESGEIRIPEGTGVVGQTVKSGQSQRVDEDIESEQEKIHREIDQELDFKTRSLVCVPMLDSKDKVIGAFQVLNKSTGQFSDGDVQALEELAAHASIAIDNTQHVEKLATSRRQIAEEAADKVHLIGQCRAIEDLRKTISRVAETELAILILGENGTGKEVVAQLIHYLSQRRDQVLVAVNCAAITESLLESELFGHEKGAFTDAHQARQGKFELANGGTLFLDEIGDMSLGGQAKLLRVLEEKIVVRVGGSTPISTDTRVIAATNQDLGKLVRDKKFREDLFFRLNVVTIELPPLRERDEDVILLAEHFLQQFCAQARRSAPRLTAAAKKRMRSHTWPGNVRELRNLMERLAYLSDGDTIDADQLAFIMSPHDSGSDTIQLDQHLADATRQFQVEYIRKHIERARGNMTEAAQKLGLHRSNLYRKMRQLEMNEGKEDDSADS